MHCPLVVIPTVRERADFCQRVQTPWRALGCEVLIFLTPDDVPRSPAQHGRSSLAALKQAGQLAGLRSLFFCEDDVRLDPTIARLPASFFGEDATTLYLPGQRFYPAHIKRAMRLPPQVPVRFPIVNGAHWFGSQCLFLPRNVIADLLQEKHAPVGFDLIVRASLTRHKRTLYSVYPNLVQHLAPPSVTSTRYKPHRSTTWIS